MTEARPSTLSHFRTSPALPVLMLVMFTATAGLGLVGPLLPILARNLGAGGIWLGLAFSGFAVSQTPLMPVFGRFSDRVGRKPFLAGGALVYALVAVGMAFAPNYYVLIGFRICGGVGAAMLFPVAMAYAGEMSPKGQEGSFMGLFQLAMMLGWSTGPLTGGLIADAFGIRYAFLSQTALSMLAVLVVLLWLPEPKRRSAGERELEPAQPSLLSILRLRPVRALSIFQVIWATNQAIIVSFSAIYLTDSLGAATAMVGVLFSARQAVSGVLQPMGGRLADRLNRTLMVVVGASVAGAMSFAIPFAPNAFAVLLLFVISGVAEAFSVPAANAIAVEQGRSVGMGALMGVVNMAMSAGLVLGGISGGFVKDALDIEATFRLAGILSIVGAGLFFLLMPGALGRAPRPVLAAVPDGPAILEAEGES